MQVSTIGLDIAKNVFQVHGIDGGGRAVPCRKIRRERLIEMFEGIEPCLIGMEACATAHHWACQLTAVGEPRRVSWRHCRLSHAAMAGWSAMA